MTLINLDCVKRPLFQSALLVMLCASACVLTQSAFAQVITNGANNTIQIKYDDDDHFTYTESEEPFQVDLRVFGYNKNTLNRRGVVIRPISHILIAAPMQAAGEVYDRNFCEADAMAFTKAKFVTTTEPAIIEELDRLSDEQQISIANHQSARKCAHLEGHMRTLKAFTSQGIDGTSQVVDFGSMKGNTREAIRLTSFKVIPCS